MFGAMTAGSGFMETMALAGLAGGFEKLTKQKLAIMREAEAAGARVLLSWDEGEYKHRSTSVRWQALTQGGLPVTSRQLFVLETGGVRHLYVQPFSADARLPGTHHLWMPGALRSPALYDASRKAFFAGPDHELAHWLQAQPIARVLREIDWDWRVASTRVVDPVVLQLRAFQGVGHLAVRAFDAAGGINIDSHPVGFRFLPRILNTLLASAGPAIEDQAFHAPTPGAEAFEALLAGTLPTPVLAPTRDLTGELQGVLASEDIGLLTRAPLPAKKEAGARRELLPGWLADQPILAMYDKTVFGGGTRGVAFTPTHLCCRTDEGGVALSYVDITGARSLVGTLGVRSQLYGDFAMSFNRPEPFAALFNALAAQRDAQPAS